MPDPFDPTFDDCQWNTDWLNFPVIQVVPGVHKSFSIRTEQTTEAEVCGRQVQLNMPLSVRILETNDGILWMSDVPQERLMMWNNAQASHGRVLVGGLGLGLYAQYALPHIDSLTIIEQNPEIIEVVQPVVQVAADSHNKPLVIEHDDIEDVLSQPSDRLYDTIFLDTWDQLDAANLPHVNTLRDKALNHVNPNGKALLWGYVWMLRLFSTAVELMRAQPASERREWLEHATSQRPDVYDLLLPVLEHLKKNPDAEQTSVRLWALNYIMKETR